MSKLMTPQMRENLKTLTEREREYFLAMWPKSGVLYITSKPGVAKSAMAREIANKMGFNYIDIRLSLHDETDMGLFPNKSKIDGQECLDFVIPRWAIEANRQPTIIHFEEMNRAQLQVRNAALGILLERQIGQEFRFNDSVLMMASGNLGDEDGTDVEEFDNALNNRLIHYNHSLGVDEWIDGYAIKNCHPAIVSYLRAYPEKLYQNPTDNTRAFATPRSWTFVSDFITCNFGIDANIGEFLPYVAKHAFGCIGNAAAHFLRYLQDMANISIKDVLNRYDEIAADLAKYNRDKKSELIASMKEHDLLKLSDKQMANLVKFLKGVGDDEVTAYILYLIDLYPSLKEPKLQAFLREFKDTVRTARALNYTPDATKQKEKS